MVMVMVRALRRVSEAVRRRSRSRRLATLLLVPVLSVAGVYGMAGFPTAAVAATGSLISGVAWADTALTGTIPASGAVYESGMTVELIDPASNNAVVATTTTDASGKYSFADVADGTYKVLVVAPSNMKFPTTATGSDVFVSTGTPASSTDPYRGVSPSLTINGATQVTNQNAGVQPIATLAVHALSQPGYNCANSSGLMVAQTDNGNCNTKTTSNVSQAFAVSVSNLATGQVVHNVTATFTFTPQNGAVLQMPGLPAGCSTTGGVSPVSSVSGNLVLVCNIGDVNSAQIAAVTPVVTATTASPNGSSFTTSVTVKAGDGTAVDSNVETNPVISISGAPNYYTDKYVAANRGPGTYTIDGVSTHGYEIQYAIHGYPQTGAGSTQLKLPLTIPDSGIPQFPNAIVVSCDGGAWGYGLNYTPVQNCPTGQTATPANPWNFTFTNYVTGTQCANLGGWVCVYPGTSEYSQIFTVFVPVSDMNKALNPAWVPGDPDQVGSLSFTNCLGAGIDGKTDATGQPNNGDGHMGGTHCSTNSFTAPDSGFPSPISAFKRYNIDGVTTKDGFFVEPGEPNVQSWIQYINNAATPDQNFSVCDYFDVSVMQLKSPNPTTITGAALPAGFEIEYGVAPNTNNDQVGALATNATYPTTPVYKYTNPDQAGIGANCNTYTGVWHTDPSAFGANWQDQVNVVRIAPIPGYTPTPAAPSGYGVNFYLNLNVRNVYNGGPNAGKTIPDGAYVPNVGSWDRGPLDSSFTSETANVAFAQDLKSNITGAKYWCSAGIACYQNNAPHTTNAGEFLQSQVYYSNTGPGPDKHFSLCDVFDVSTMQLSHNNAYMWGNVLPPGFEIEYGVVPNTVNSQVGSPTVGNGYAQPIYGYANADQQSAALNCSTIDANWTTTPATTLGANWTDQVNAVRVAPIPGYTPTPSAPPNWSTYLVLDLTARAVYNGGSNAGQAIPTGAYIPNVGSWDTPTNAASPISTQTGAIAYQAYKLGLTKTVNTNATYQPGGQIQWTLQPQITQGAVGKAVTGVTVTDTIPANTTYDAACTQANLPNGVTAVYNTTANTVTFAYSQSFLVAATLPQNLPSFKICTNIITTTRPGSGISNTATIASNESPVATASNAAAVTVQGAGNLAISKSVDKQTIRSGDTYNWTLTWGNTTTVAFAAPQIIDVLPYNGDGSSGASSQRLNGSSSFSGTNELTGPLAQPTYSAGSTDSGDVTGTWYYTTASPTTIKQNPNDPSNQNPGSGASIWVTAAGVTDWSQVTGIYFLTSGFINGGNTVTVQVPMKADSGGVLGDIYVNQAELFTSSAPDNPVVSNNPYTQIPGITIVKTANPSTVTAAGQTVTYTFTVANEGKVSVNNVSVSDTQAAPSVAASLGPITCKALSTPAAPCSGAVIPTLAGGQIATFTASYVTTQADVDAGTITDTAVANAVTNPGGAPITSTPSTAIVTATQSPGISVAKTASPTTVTAVGQQVTYTFVATNTGNVTLTAVGITDNQVAPALNQNMGTITCTTLTSPAAACSGATTTLAPGQSATFTGVYTVQQADTDNGTITDKATAHGTPANSTTPLISNEASAVVTVTQSPAITVEKNSTTTLVTAVGQRVPYTFLVTNTGNVTLAGVSVTDTVASPSKQSDLTDPICPKATLAAGESMTCTATYTTTQADLDHDHVDDSAIASGIPPATTVDPNPPAVVSPKSPKSIPVEQSPSIDLVKTGVFAGGAIAKKGDLVDYTFRVTNTGNVTLAAVAITDQLSGISDITFGAWPNGVDRQLAPGQSVTATATYPVTQADVDDGKVSNSATATGVDPKTNVVHSDDTVVVPLPSAPSIHIVKQTSSSVTKAGDPVDYTFTVTNTGPLTLYGVAVTDPMKGLSPILFGAWPDPSQQFVLAPGQSVTATASYTATQDDVNAGMITNTATTTGTSKSGAPARDDSSAIITITPKPSITLTKDGVFAGGTNAKVGDPIDYSFTVTNTGNVTLTNVTIDDPMLAPGSIRWGAWPDPAKAGTLQPGETVTATATYPVTQADIDRPDVTNTAKATGDDPNGKTVDDTASHKEILKSTPTISLDKETTSVVKFAGDQVTYTFTATNTGPTTLANVKITDPMPGLSTIVYGAWPGGAGTEGTLAPGQSVTATATYDATPNDVKAGRIDNTATVNGRSLTGIPVTDSHSAEVIITPAPSIALVKATTTPTVTVVGQRIPYTFTVTNTGNVPLDGVTVTDVLDAPSQVSDLEGPVCAQSTLAPGEVAVCTATYTVTQADIDNGTITDHATAAGTPPHTSDPVVSPPSSVTVLVAQTTGLTVEKKSTTTAATMLGQKVPYTFTVTNTGNVTIRNIHVTDTVAAPSVQANLSPVVCPSDALVGGGVMVCTATYTIAAPDLNSGTVSDTAVADGDPANGPPLTSNRSKLSLPAVDPQVALPVVSG